MKKEQEALRTRLIHCMKREDESLNTLDETANEMRSISRECEELGVNYNKLLIYVCQTLSAERKGEP